MQSLSDVKKRILESAVEEFSEVGLAGARVNRIATKANINKQRIYAYFGNKSALFDAAVSEGFRRLRTAVPVAKGREDLVDYTLRLYDFHVGNPDLSRLLLWEQLERPLISGRKRADHHDGRITDYVGFLETTDEEEALRLSLMLVSLAAWPPSNRQVVMDVTSSDQAAIQGILEGEMRTTVERSARAIVDAWTAQTRPPDAGD